MLIIFGAKEHGVHLKKEGWDFPIDELSCLLEEHDREAFQLKDGRLYEVDKYATRCDGCCYLVEGDDGSVVCDADGSDIYAIKNDECPLSFW